VDNAAIHKAAEIADDLADVLDTAGVRLLFLPAYSPELNPCELLFGQAKQHIRNHRGHLRFWLEVLRGFLSCSRDNMMRYYARCIGTDVW
jgi:transposase